MTSITLYTTRWCPFCIRAKQLLSDKGYSFEEISVDNDPAKRQEMTEKAGATSVPQIWINQQHIGGCDELYKLERNGQLDSLLAQS